MDYDTRSWHDSTLIDAAEDPEKMLDQMVRDYTNNIREAEAAVAQTIGKISPEEQLKLLGGAEAFEARDKQRW